ICFCSALSSASYPPFFSSLFFHAPVIPSLYSLSLHDALPILRLISNLLLHIHFTSKTHQGMSLNSLHAFLILRMTLNFQELVRLGSFVMKRRKSLKHYQNII